MKKLLAGLLAIALLWQAVLSSTPGVTAFAVEGEIDTEENVSESIELERSVEMEEDVTYEDLEPNDVGETGSEEVGINQDGESATENDGATESGDDDTGYPGDSDGEECVFTPEQAAIVGQYIVDFRAYLARNSAANPLLIPSDAVTDFDVFRAVLAELARADVDPAGLLDTFEAAAIVLEEQENTVFGNGYLTNLTIMVSVIDDCADEEEWLYFNIVTNQTIFFEREDGSGSGGDDTGNNNDDECVITPEQEEAIALYVAEFRNFLAQNSAANPIVISSGATTPQAIFMEVADALIHADIDLSMLDVLDSGAIWMNIETQSNTVFGAGYITNMTIWIEVTLCETVTRHYLATNQTVFFSNNDVRVPTPPPGSGSEPTPPVTGPVLPQTGVTSVPLIWAGVALFAGGAVLKVKKD